MKNGANMNEGTTNEIQTANAIGAASGDKLLTLAQVAEKLQVGRVTCWRLYAERGLRVVRIGRSVRVRPADLESWLAKNASGAGDNGEGQGAV